jgi:hypothetical protein
MNYKSLVIVALAVCLVACVPVSAMWNNGNWVSDDRNNNCDQIKFDPKTGVTSCYRDANPAIQIAASNEGNGGVAVGSIRAGYSTLSNTIEVKNVLQNQSEPGMIIKVNADATFRIPEPDHGVLAPGNYTATLDNFNLPDETVYFTIAANQQEPTRFSFNGQAASSPADHKVVYTILKATYGATREDCTMSEWSRHRPNHGEYETRIVTDNAAYDTYNYVGAHHGDYNKQGNSYVYVGHNNGSYDICHHEAQTHKEYRYETCSTYGQNLDVTQNVQSVVDQGITSFFFFDNAQSPGGIFGQGNVLLSQIQDPAVGIVKNVYIHYTRDGMDKTITTMEYQQINL